MYVTFTSVSYTYLIAFVMHLVIFNTTWTVNSLKVVSIRNKLLSAIYYTLSQVEALITRISLQCSLRSITSKYSSKLGTV